jgi:PBSX family phage terminase large subunit
MEEIRSTNQSALRGGDHFNVFYTYNPPRVQASWVNLEAQHVKEDRYSHHSTYLDVPPEWLGEKFISDALHLKEVNPLAYDHEYMGNITGTGGKIFYNVFEKIMDHEEIYDIKSLRQGIDWGYANDPFCWVNIAFDRKKRAIYIFDEIFQKGLLNKQASDAIKEKWDFASPWGSITFLTADSEEPKSVSELKSYNLPCYSAVKGKGSVGHGMKWLMELEAIYIDPVKCPNTLREFSTYELEKNKDGTWKDAYPDKDNHSIDAVRYALERDMDRKSNMFGVN